MIEVTTNIKGTINGAFAYIYIWYSKKARIAYVGQTNERHGVVGRASAHISRHGTLRTRLLEKDGSSIEDFDDWVLMSYRFPFIKKYISNESSYRLAVEYLVQTLLIEERGKLNPPLRLISNVTYTDYCNSVQVRRLASEIIEEFKSSYRSNR